MKSLTILKGKGQVLINDKPFSSTIAWFFMTYKDGDQHTKKIVEKPEYIHEVDRDHIINIGQHLEDAKTHCSKTEPCQYQMRQSCFKSKGCGDSSFAFGSD